MQSLSRRQALQSLGLGAASVLLGQKAFGQAATPPAGPFRLPPLPYANNALEPSIDARTMEIHHDRHHKAYVDNLNTAIAGNAALSAMTIDQIVRGIDTVVPMNIRQAVKNNGGGHWNHTFFWSIMGPNAGGNPQGPLAEAINSTFTSLAQFKTAFKAACMTRFGSGWGWLVKNAAGRLEIVSTQNQDCPLSDGKTPILGCDVWEHAYYLHYQNNRSGYIDAWWNVVNWTAAAQRFTAA